MSRSHFSFVIVKKKILRVIQYFLGELNGPKKAFFFFKKGIISISLHFGVKLHVFEWFCEIYTVNPNTQKT